MESGGVQQINILVSDLIWRIQKILISELGLKFVFLFLLA